MGRIIPCLYAWAEQFYGMIPLSSITSCQAAHKLIFVGLQLNSARLRLSGLVMSGSTRLAM